MYLLGALEHCRGQAFDGASSISGFQKATSIIEKPAKEIVIMSTAFAIQEVTKRCVLLRNVMDFHFS